MLLLLMDAVGQAYLPTPDFLLARHLALPVTSPLRLYA